MHAGSICRRFKRRKGRARHVKKKEKKEKGPIARAALFFFFFPVGSLHCKRRWLFFIDVIWIKRRVPVHHERGKKPNRGAQQGRDRASERREPLRFSIRRERGSQGALRRRRKSSSKMGPRPARADFACLFLSSPIDVEQSTAIARARGRRLCRTGGERRESLEMHLISSVALARWI